MCHRNHLRELPLMGASRFARSTSRPGEENDRSGWWVEGRGIDAGRNSKKKRWEWHVRTCYDCCLDRAGLIMDGLHSAAEMTEARLPLLRHIRGSYVLLLLEAAPRLRLATQMSFLTWEVNSSFSRGLLAGPFYWLGISTSSGEHAHVSWEHERRSCMTHGNFCKSMVTSQPRPCLLESEII